MARNTKSGSSRGGSRGGNRGGSRSNRGGNSGGGFPSWGLYALGGLAIAGIIYGLSKYGPTSEAIGGWIDSASGMFGGEDEDTAYASDFDADEEGTTNAAGGTSYGSVQ